MAYSELIKNFEKVRSYMRDFYVYGFKGRDEFDARSARIYDDEYRRVKAWLEGYIDSYYDESGKKVFISIDSRTLSHNPLYIAFKTRSFTDWDIVLHFCLLDILTYGPATVQECVERITAEYLEPFEAEFPDERTVRNKLKEYEKMGIVLSEKKQRNIVYTLAKPFRQLPAWRDAIDFFSETAPLGVIGSYFPQKNESAFEFKHQYFLGALDSEVLFDLCQCMEEHRSVELTIFSRRKKQELKHPVYPMRFYFSTQSGRQYILGYHYAFRKPMFFRLDGIRKIKPMDVDPNSEKYEEFWKDFDRHLWGVSTGEHTLDHIEMQVHAGLDEWFIADRLKREKRHGVVEQINDETWKFTADVYDASEMMPWLRTFIGRIVKLECSNENITRLFREDLEKMRCLYGGEP